MRTVRSCTHFPIDPLFLWDETIQTTPSRALRLILSTSPVFRVLLLLVFMAWVFGLEISSVAYADSPGGEVNCADVRDKEDRLVCYDNLLTCRNQVSDEARLACFDRSFGAWVASRGSEPALKVEPVVQQAVSSNASEASDKDVGFGKKSKRVKLNFSASVTNVQTDGRRIDYLTLDNGQIWRETVDSKVRFKQGQTVTIESGILGSYNLHAEGTRRLVKVKRLK